MQHCEMMRRLLPAHSCSHCNQFKQWPVAMIPGSAFWVYLMQFKKGEAWWQKVAAALR